MCLSSDLMNVFQYNNVLSFILLPCFFVFCHVFRNMHLNTFLNLGYIKFIDFQIFSSVNEMRSYIRIRSSLSTKYLCTACQRTPKIYYVFQSCKLCLSCNLCLSILQQSLSISLSVLQRCLSIRLSI